MRVGQRLSCPIQHCQWAGDSVAAFFQSLSRRGGRRRLWGVKQLLLILAMVLGVGRRNHLGLFLPKSFGRDAIAVDGGLVDIVESDDFFGFPSG